MKDQEKLTGPRLMVSAAADATDVLYATGFAAVDPVVYVRIGCEDVLLVPALELGRARESAPQATVLTPEDLQLPRLERKKMSSWVAAFLRSRRLRSVHVSACFPFGMAQRLQRLGIRVKLTHDPAFPERQIKRPDEIKHLRVTQSAAVTAMRHAIAVVRGARPDRKGVLRTEGGALTSERVRYEIDLALLQHNCSATDTIVACGHDAFNPHSRGHGPLRGGQPIVIDIFPQHRGSHYWGDITRTVVRGRASETLRAMHAAVKEAQQAALRRLRPGVKTSAVHEVVEETLKRHGFETSVRDGVAQGFIHSTGHGVGLDIHEAPSIRNAPGILCRGHVVTVEPGLYYPDAGGVRIEDTVAVTARGWSYLAPMEERLEI